MKFKDYVLEYLVNKDDLDWDVICELDGFKEDFNASGKNNMLDWLDSLIKDIEIVDYVNCKYNEYNDSEDYDLIFKSGNTYYSLSIEYSRDFRIDKVLYNSLKQVKPVQKIIYEPVESKV